MSERFSGEINAPLCVDCRSPMFDDDEPDEAGRCSGCQDGHGDDPMVDRLDQGWLTTEDLERRQPTQLPQEGQDA